MPWVCLFLIGAIGALGALGAGASPPWLDAFTNPSPNNETTVDAGSDYSIEWHINGSDTAKVDLYLMSGPRANALSVYLTIGSGIPDNGSHDWNIPDDLVDQGYFAFRLTPNPNPSSLSVTSAQFYLDVLKAENPCYSGTQRCYPPLLPGWHHRLAIVLGSIFGGLVLACGGCCFCIWRRGMKRRRSAEYRLTANGPEAVGSRGPSVWGKKTQVEAEPARTSSGPIEGDELRILISRGGYGRH